MEFSRVPFRSRHAPRLRLRSLGGAQPRQHGRAGSGGVDRAPARPGRSGFSRELFAPSPAKAGEGWGGVPSGIAANRGYPLPASPCLRRGRSQGESSRLKPLLQEVLCPVAGRWTACRVARAQPIHPSSKSANSSACSSSCARIRSEEHTSELQSLMRISSAVFCLKKKIKKQNTQHTTLKNKTKYMSATYNILTTSKINYTLARIFQTHNVVPLLTRTNNNSIGKTNIYEITLTRNKTHT